MKRKLFLLLIPLLAVLGCQRELDGYEGLKTQEVKTQFVFNISTGSQGKTKQDAAATQNDGSFRGISEARLMTFSLSADDKILSKDQDADKVYDLATMMQAAEKDSYAPRRVVEMSLPLNTNTMLFYGRAPAGDYDKFGHLDEYTIKKDAGSANFQLGKRLKKETRFYTTEKYLAAVLTVIMNTSYTYTKGESQVKLYWEDYAAASGNSPVETEHALYPLEEKLSYLYKQMTNIRYKDDGQTKEVELRAAYGEAITAMIRDLWTVVNSVRCATPISDAETVAQNFAITVHNHLSTYFEASNIPTNGGPVTGVSFKSIKDNNEDYPILLDSHWPADGNITADKDKPSKQKPSSADMINVITTSDSLYAFPLDFGVIRGATYLTFNAVGKFFYYPKYFNTSAVGSPTDEPESGFTAASYFYPAELLYFGNSPIRTSDLAHVTTDYPSTTDDWLTSAKWKAATEATAESPSQPDWVGKSVKSTTHSVAMKNTINYGVAMLETKVGYTDEIIGSIGSAGLGYLEDNNHAVQKLNYPGLADGDEPNKQIPVKAGSFKLVGIVIGGQPQNVGWDFLPIQVDSKFKTGFIYDKADSNVMADNGSDFTPVYTTVFDNFKGTLDGDGYWKPATAAANATTGQETVYVALEFQNNTGVDFYGNFNLIRNGGYFYLIGALDPATGGKITWPTATEDMAGHLIPPYNRSGASQEVPRVFIQDYKTSVTFKFGKKSLQYAYLTVPDLRASSLTMGLSVDIEWRSGLTYNEIVIGGN